MKAKKQSNDSSKKKSAVIKKGKEPKQAKNGKLKVDSLLWLLVIVLIVAGIALNSYYNQVAGALRAAGGIVLSIIIIAIAAATSQGKKAWEFIKGARTELRKVVWPTRQETVQTTLVVVAMVLVAALILWGLDSLFLWAISWLTGQRG